MLFQIQAYLKFLWRSKNEHGVHSPFVFDLVTKCFYDKKNKLPSATLGAFPKSDWNSAKIKLLYRTARYFQPATIALLGTSTELEQTVLEAGNPKAALAPLPSKTQKCRLLYIDALFEKEIEPLLNAYLPSVENETVWIFNAIHGSAQQEAKWQRIQNHPQVSVTIDTFQLGFVFFRTEQKKEHFVIRS